MQGQNVGTGEAIYIETGAKADKPELLSIIHSLIEVTERLEQSGQALMAFEPKVCLNGVQPTPEATSPKEPSENYNDNLRSILGRLRALDEEKLTPALAMFEAFL